MIQAERYLDSGNVTIGDLPKTHADAVSRQIHPGSDGEHHLAESGPGVPDD